MPRNLLKLSFTLPPCIRSIRTSVLLFAIIREKNTIVLCPLCPARSKKNRLDRIRRMPHGTPPTLPKRRKNGAPAGFFSFFYILHRGNTVRRTCRYPIAYSGRQFIQAGGNDQNKTTATELTDQLASVTFDETRFSVVFVATSLDSGRGRGYSVVEMPFVYLEQPEFGCHSFAIQ